MRVTATWSLVPLLTIASSCLDAGPLPVVRSDVLLSEPVIRIADRLEVTVTLANNGPGELLAVVYCPGFVVRDSVSHRVGPNIPCSAMADVPFVLQAGEVRTFEHAWSEIDLRPGIYSVSITARAVTPDRTVLTIVDTPAEFEIIR